MRIEDKGEWLDFYFSNGFAVIEDVFTKKEMDSLRRDAMTEFRDISLKNLQWKNSYPALMFWPRLGFWARDERMQEIVTSVLGDGSIKQLNHQYYFRMPGDGDQFAWHQDITFRHPKENFENIETGYLQTAIIVDDMDEENGGIWFGPGTHRQGDLGLVERGTENRLRDQPSRDMFGEAVCPRVSSGSVMIWSVMVVHGSEQNNSNRHRAYLMNGFAKAECVKDPQFPYYIKR